MLLLEVDQRSIIGVDALVACPLRADLTREELVRPLLEARTCPAGVSLESQQAEYWSTKAEIFFVFPGK